LHRAARCACLTHDILCPSEPKARRRLGSWPNLTGKFRPHDDRHTHATWLDVADLHKVIQMDRRGHAMPGMDAVYNHITLEMRRRLCDVLEDFWRTAVVQPYELAPSSAVLFVE
jgi:integrase